MKRILLTIFLLAMAGTASAALKDANMIAYYRCDDINTGLVLDANGGHYNGITSEANSLPATGHCGTSLETAWGTSGIKEMFNATYPRFTNSFSISLWLKDESVDSYTYIFKAKTSVENPLNIITDNFSDDYIDFQVQCISGTLHAASIPWNSMLPGWNHLVAVWDRWAVDGHRIKLYLNGALAAYDAGVDDVLVGSETETYTSDFSFMDYDLLGGHAYIDETYISSRALTPTEVNTLYNGGACYDYNNLSPPTYNLTVTTDGNGTSIPDVCTASPGTVITITATPSAHYRPSATVWTGDANGSESNIANVNSYSTTYTMGSANATIEAHFDVNLYTLTVTAGTGGTVTPTSATLAYGATVSVTATALSGYALATPIWTGDTAGVSDVNSATITYTMGDVNAAIHANFVSNTSTLTYYYKRGPNEPCMVGALSGVTPWTIIIYAGQGHTTPTIWTGTAATNGWVDDVTSIYATVTVQGDCNLIGNYNAGTDNRYLVIAADGNGLITSPNPGGTPFHRGILCYTVGSVVDINASANTGFCWLDWSGSTTQMANFLFESTTITLNQANNIPAIANANFTTNCPTVTVIYPWGVIH